MLKKAIILTAAMFYSAVTAAGQGNTIIPSWFSSDNGSNSNQTYFQLALSNVTSESTSVKVKLYDVNGALYKARSGDTFTVKYSDARSFTEVDSTLEIVIGPYKTVRFTALTGSVQEGYGVIEWSQSEGQNANALVANAYQMVYITDFSHRSERAVPINNGMVF
ncbi:hypothetical protein OE749_03155 [Aestuariibacter sp. AA17]|uniref:Uncharacterized protein n=1 Tax=Fluctibacter corallii TaxID=2984329 RepID=A0ABT3A4Y4_9ALTE|nr:hypothetical protein [Aestuariibacter sp. AA17]MCV2883699.1 hypothetical protein [Aestuariibacter sp. AA17]